MPRGGRKRRDGCGRYRVATVAFPLSAALAGCIAACAAPPSEPAGAAIGLFLFQVPFELMAILGFLSLSSMGVHIILGLTFATLLTLIVVPLLYAVPFRRQDHAPA